MHGAGNDKVTFKVGFLTGGASGDVLDGGAGTDTLVINDTAPVYTKTQALRTSKFWRVPLPQLLMWLKCPPSRLSQ